MRLYKEELCIVLAFLLILYVSYRARLTILPVNVHVSYNFVLKICIRRNRFYGES